MNSLIVFDARKVVPDSFALVLAAAARARALRQGAEPRVNAGVEPGPSVALSEIASGAFREEELAPLLPDGRAVVPRLAAPETWPKLCDGGQTAATAPVLPPRTLH